MNEPGREGRREAGGRQGDAAAAGAEGGTDGGGNGAEGNSTELTSARPSSRPSIRPSVALSLLPRRFMAVEEEKKEGGDLVRVVKLCSGPVERAKERKNERTNTR